jgi:CIC family chloride channel protein
MDKFSCFEKIILRVFVRYFINLQNCINLITVLKRFPVKIHNKKKYLSFLKFKRDFQKYGLEKARSYELILHWLNNRLSRNQFLVLSGILVGCTAGLAGVILKTLVHNIHYFITNKVHFEYQIFLYRFPFLGIVLTTLIVLTLFKGQDRKGIGAILYEIAQNSSIVASVKMYSQVIQSAITVGLGGSAGLESPIAVTGAAIGSNYAQTYRLSYKERTLLLAAGATAGIASAFNAPIAGIMFAFEILLTGVVFTDFIPLVVAAVCGVFCREFCCRKTFFSDFIQEILSITRMYHIILSWDW